MFKTILALSLAAMTLSLVSAASAEELPTDSVCNMAAEAAYSAAVEAGDGLPDGAYEQAMNDCDWGGYSDLTLNEQIEQDGEAWLPSCQFAGGCIAR